MGELLLVPAGAGAGKTHRIKETLTGWVRDGLVRPERILAVTFTDAAAGELRQRIRSSLLGAGLVDAALAVDRAYVSTIHALGLRLLTEHALANGSSPLPRLIADEERELLLRGEIARCEPLQRIGRDLYRYGYVYDHQLELSAEDVYRERVFNTVNLLRSLGDRGEAAGLAALATSAIRAGYGPCRDDGASLGDGLCDAARRMVEAFPKGVAHIGTSDAARRKFDEDIRSLRRARDRATLDRDWPLWQKLRNLRRAMKGCPTPPGYDELASEVMEAAEALPTHPGPLADAAFHAEALIGGCQQILAGYAERKSELGVIDYADMVTNAERLLRRDPGVLASVLGEVDCVIVDEFQDTNPIQFALLWRLARLAPRTLLVGDVKQAIMGFQGADARLSDSLMAANPQRVQPLDRNWRSDPLIMDFVNALGPRLFPDNYIPLAPVRPVGNDPALEALVMEKGRGGRSGTPRPEHHVAARIQNLLETERPQVVDRHSGESRPLVPRDVAVLCHTHVQAARYAAALRTLGLPVRINTDGWHSSLIVQAARDALALAADPSDRHAALCFATLGPLRMPLDRALQALADNRLFDEPGFAPLRALAPSAAAMAVPALLAAAIDATGLRDWAERLDEPRQARADLLRLEAEAQAFVQTHRDMKAAAGFHGGDARVFLGWLASRVSERDFDRHPDPSSGTADGVEIVTWHACKGREWPVVVAACLDQPFLPRPGTLHTKFPSFEDLDRVLDPAELHFCPGFAATEVQDRFLSDLKPAAETTARRLLYVILTRARDRLIVEWPHFNVKDGVDPQKGLRTHAELLVDAGAMSVEDNALLISKKAFPARVTHCGGIMPEAFGIAKEDITMPKRYGYGRAAILPRPRRPEGAPWLVLPSGLETAGLPLPADVRREWVGAAFAAPDHLFGANTDRGTALHQALRVMMARPDLRARLAAHTGLDSDTLDHVARQAEALRKWLADSGFTDIRHEVPLVGLDALGSNVSAILDCLAEGGGGLAILDHKSDPVPDTLSRFPVYWPQLSAYVAAARRAWPRKRVRRIGVHWLTRGTVTWCEV